MDISTDEKENQVKESHNVVDATTVESKDESSAGIMDDKKRPATDSLSTTEATSAQDDAITKDTPSPSKDVPSTATNDNTGVSDNISDKKDAAATASAATLRSRPVKRARTAYFIFVEEKRAEIQKEHAGEGAASISKAMGQIWATLNDDEKKIYQEKAAQERTRVAEELKAWIQAGGVIDDAATKSGSNSTSASSSSLIFPVARIKKICKLDPEVKNLSKEATLLVTKAAELMVAKIGSETVRVAQIQNRRKLLPEDVAQVCSSREQFLFLREDIADLTRLQQKEAAEAAEKSKSDAAGGDGKDSAASAKHHHGDDAGPKMKPLTAYFGSK